MIALLTEANRLRVGSFYGQKKEKLLQDDLRQAGRWPARRAGPTRCVVLSTLTEPCKDIFSLKLDCLSCLFCEGFDSAGQGGPPGRASPAARPRGPDAQAGQPGLQPGLQRRQASPCDYLMKQEDFVYHYTICKFYMRLYHFALLEPFDFLCRRNIARTRATAPSCSFTVPRPGSRTGLFGTGVMRLRILVKCQSPLDCFIRDEQLLYIQASISTSIVNSEVRPLLFM